MLNQNMSQIFALYNKEGDRYAMWQLGMCPKAPLLFFERERAQRFRKKVIGANDRGLWSVVELNVAETLEAPFYAPVGESATGTDYRFFSPKLFSERN